MKIRSVGLLICGWAMLWCFSACESQELEVKDWRAERKEVLEELKQEEKWAAEALDAMRQAADFYLNHVPQAPEIWQVPLLSEDSAAFAAARKPLLEDANAAYTLAGYAFLSGNKKYAAPAANILNSWISRLSTISRKGNSSLTFAVFYPRMIHAAEMLAPFDVWTPEMEQRFRQFTADKALPAAQPAWANNWGSWGNYLVATIGRYLGRDTLLDYAENRWKTLIQTQIEPEGYFPLEVERGGGRQGLGYTHFCLLAQSLTAQELAAAGRPVWDYSTEKGQSLELVFRKAAEWTRYPEKFRWWQGDTSLLTNRFSIGYFEILQPHWPDAYAKVLLEQYRPLSDDFAPWMTVWFGE